MDYISINDCCEILDSQRIPVTESERIKGPYPYYGANGIQDYVDNYIFDDELVLVAEDGGHFGSRTKPIAYRVSGKCWVNNHAHVLKPKDFINVDYLCYALMFYDTGELIKGATRQKLNQKDLRSMKIPNLNIKEQLVIVKELNNIFNAINISNEKLEYFDELIKSRFIELFGTIDMSLQDENWKPLSELSKIYTVTTPSTSNEENWNGNILWVTPAELNIDSFYIFDTERKITNVGKRSKSLDLMPVGTVLLSTRAPIGKVAIVAKPMCCNQGFKNFFLNEKMNPIFLYVLLKHNTDYLNSLGTGTTFKEISKTCAGKIKVPCPNIDLQNEFAEFVKLIDKSKFDDYSRYFLCDILTLASSTSAYSSVVSIFVWPNIC